MNKKILNKIIDSNINYLIFRYCIIFVGIIIILGTYSTHFLMPGLYYDTGPVPPMNERILDIFLPLLYAILLILPHRFSLKGISFYLKLILFTIASIWLFYAGFSGIYHYFGGAKHWLIIPSSIIFIILAIITPLSLLWKKNIIAKQPINRTGL